MKIKYTFIGTILFAWMQAQNNTKNSFPDIRPPSAETYRFSTYGLDFANSPSGEFTHNLPVYSIGQGTGLTVNLAYNSGIKADDMGGNMGMSWQLIAGGAISRIVRDEQDETSSSVWFPQTIDDTNDADQIKGAAHPDNSIDTEYDWFSFTLSNGLSGQFYIDKALNVHYNGGDGSTLSITDKTTVVTQYGKKLEFVLTDNQGNTYYFGGDDQFMERTRINYKGPDKYYTSGWYLAKVITNKNEVITFDYSVENISYFASMRASFSLSESCCSPQTYEYSDLTKSRTTLTSLKPQLVAINDDKTRISFTYNKQRKDILNGTGKLLTSIAVHAKSNNQQIKNYTLNYDDVSAGAAITYYGVSATDQSTVNRHFLNSVQDIVTNQKYRFEYYSKENIPARFSLATDAYGYSNGKNNSTPFPGFAGQISSVYLNKIPVGVTGADKEVAPERTYLGNLKRIYYPTGGYSEITYESNSNMETVPVQKSDETGLQASRNCTDPKTIKKKFTFVSNGSAITYNATASTDYSYCGQPDSHEVHGVSIRDLTDPSVPVKSSSGNYSVILSTDNCSTGGPNDTCPVNTVAGHTYEVEYSVTSYFGRIDGIANVNYNSRTEMLDVLKHYGGSRVSKIEENNTENGSYSRLFYYTAMADRSSGKTSIANAAAAKYFDFLMTKRNCKLECVPNPEINFLIVDDIPAYRFFKDNLISDFSDRPNKPFYKTVTEIIEGNKAVERSYLYEDDALPYYRSPQILDAPHSNSGQIRRGQLLSEKQYSFRNNNFGIFKETINQYNYNQTAITSFIFRQNFALPPGYIPNPQDGPIPNISYTYYQNYYGYSKLTESLSKEYIGGNTLETKVTNSYANTLHLQPTSQKVAYPDTSVRETNYSYAHEKGNQLMISKNMTGIPLETETKETLGTVSKTVSKTETVYPTSLPTPETGNLVLPLSEKSYDILNNAPSTDITYNLYDTKGNIQQYTAKEGIPVTIIWGYNQTQPIAKIEGLKLSDIPQSLIDSIVNPSNTDAAAAVNNDETPFLTALDNFRKNSALFNYQVTTYTYDPLVGVRSITQPSGIREVYTYDSANRLKEIKVWEKNSAGNYVYKTVKEFKYNYKP